MLCGEPMDTRVRTILLAALFFAGCGGAPASNIRLRQVVLYQNGVGYFERAGRVGPQGLSLRVNAHEIDDVLTTLTVVDRSASGRALTPSAVVPPADREARGAHSISIGLGGDVRDVLVAYATPTSAWRASYRVVLPDGDGVGNAVVQGWAVVDNTTAEDWRDVELVLATAAPLSFAVDLRTPRIVPRPDVTGYVTPPIAFGPVFAERTTRNGDRDGDAVPDAEDLCPDDPEDRDDFEDVDGCPDPDQDADGILDVDDACPSEPELYNGHEDDDGCPDRGEVVVQESALRILDQVYFARDSAEIQDRTRPILDAMAATLRAHADIAAVDVEGHASDEEERPWALSAERAAAVQQALVERGVESARLRVRPFGSTRALASGQGEGGRDRNRRVEMRIAERAVPAESGREPQGVRGEALSRTVRGNAIPRLATSGSRHVIARPVSVPAGASMMVTMLDRRMQGEDIFLFRPEVSVPDSASHPFRAARLRNDATTDFVPGPVALFAHGEFVGEGLIDGLRAGQTTFIPYALDDSAHVESSTEDEMVPSDLLAVRGGNAHVERVHVLRTRYAIEVGARAPSRVFIRHARAPGHEPRALPPESETSPTALLVPIPIRAGRDSTIVIEERAPVLAVVSLSEDLATDLRAYLRPDAFEASAEQRLGELLDDRDALKRVIEEAALLQQRLGENGQRAEELRRSVRSLEGAAGGAIAVRRRIAERLDRAVSDGEVLAQRLAQLRAEETEARARLREAVRDFTAERRPN